MIGWLLQAFRLPHFHSWKSTRLNPWAITTEQRCRCGAARHLWELADVMPIDAPPKWRDGKHPMAPDA